MDYLFGIVVLLCGAVQLGRGAEPKHNVPRLKLSYKEMLESSNLVTFNGLANSSSYDTFLLDEERGRLLVGAEDHIFSFDLVNINRDHKQIAWPATPSKRDECKWAGKDLGDNIFRLASQFENGRGKSPYDPKMLSASLLIDMGTVLKVVTIPRESWHDLEEVVLEEMTVFREPTPITAMELSTKQKYVRGSGIGRTIEVISAFYTSILMWSPVFVFPLNYNSSFSVNPDLCPKLRNVHPERTKRSLSRTKLFCHNKTPIVQDVSLLSRRTRRQDIRNGDPLSQCSDLQHHDDVDGLGGSVEDRSVFGVENSSMFLECSPKSQRALIYWQLQKPNDDRKQEIKLDDRVLRTDQGLLIRSLTQSDAGVYHCHAIEHGFIQPLLRLSLQVIPTQRLADILPGLPGAGGGSGHSPKHRVWYRDFLSLLDHPELNSVEEFCDRVWKKGAQTKAGEDFQRQQPEQTRRVAA
ncbi:Semaphorin-3aa [Oryzias melastigma]|uniref:Semaphorin-3aa n=1 Tax=Oryzias melastigma TaxID=30732 RepID=A0A834CAE2_ORYME|nr:Semaphorin-3aa [Oryzias melastigma]